MGYFASRAGMFIDYARERATRHAPALVGDPAEGVVFVLDGIGGILMGPLIARIGFREAGLKYATYVFDWHTGPRGEMLGDLMRLRHARFQGARLARLIRAFHRAHPASPLHVLAFSGGTGVAVFAAERLGRRARLNTMVLACSALSPDYPLTPALRNVDRCIAMVSRKDYGFLGLGTCLFGTIDRRFGRSAGLVGFRTPRVRHADDAQQYQKLHQVFWTPQLARLGHTGHHMGWASRAYVREHIARWLNGSAECELQGAQRGATA